MINTLAKILIVAALITILAAAYNLYTNNNDIQPGIRLSNKAKILMPSERRIKQEIEVDAQVVPEKEIKVSPEISGKLEMLAVSEGDRVSTGQQLASIEHRELLAQLNQAKAKLEQARAELEKAKAGARKEDIQIAEQKISEAKIQIEANKTALSNSIRAAIDSVDDLMEKVDEFFTDEDAEKPQINVRYLDQDGQATVERYRKELQAPLFRLAKTEVKLRDFEYVQAAKASELLADSQLLFDTLSKIKQMVGDMETLAGDALDSHPSFRRLLEMQSAMQEARLAVENIKSSVHGPSSNLKLAVSKLIQAETSLHKLLAGTRKEDLEALEANLRLAEASVSAAESKLNKASILAPSSGTVSKIYKEKGEFVSSLEPILSIITDGVFVKARVPEVDISKVKLGMPVDIKFDAYKSKRFKGEVYFIYPAQKEINNIVYYEIKILIKDPDAKNYEILPGMTASVFVPTVNKNAEISIPLSIVQKDDKGEFVNVLRKGAVNPFVPQKVYIKLGDKDNKYVEVLSGLNKTDKIVIGKE